MDIDEEDVDLYENMTEEELRLELEEAIRRAILSEHKYFTAFVNFATSILGQERKDFVFLQTAQSFQSDIYKYQEETIEMFLRRKIMEFKEQFYYEDDDETDKRYRKTYSVYNRMRQFLTDQEINALQLIEEEED